MTPEQQLINIREAKFHLNQAWYFLHHSRMGETDNELYSSLNDEINSIYVRLVSRSESLKKDINRINNFMPEGHLNKESD